MSLAIASIEVPPETSYTQKDQAFVGKGTTEMSERILPRIAAGDKSAVDQCLSQYGGLVWSLTSRYCSAKEEADDAVQEIFTDLWQSAHR